MKRYLLFSGHVYYPRGGWMDYRGSYETVEEAVKAAKSDSNSAGDFWFHVTDSETGSICLYDVEL